MYGLGVSKMTSILFTVAGSSVCRWVQTVDHTLEAGLGYLVPESHISRHPWVGACLRICWYFTLFQE